MRALSKSIIIISCFIALILTSKDVKSQQADSLIKKFEELGDYLLYRNHDTNYIYNYGNEVAVKLLSVNKYNYFTIRDRINNTRLKYRPVRDISLGMGVSSKWFAVDITVSLGLRNKSEFENTKSLDFQGRMFSSKQFISTTIQYYQGYKLSNVAGTDVNVSEESTRREDIRTINFGLQYMYAFNYTEFSMKAPFVFNEVQLKSAGSVIIGASFSMFVMDADSSIVPPEISTFFEPDLHLLDLNVLSAAVSLGYMYSFVYKKHFFLTISLIPGININSGDYLTETRNMINPNFNFKLNTMNAIGYNGRKFFTGIHFLADGFFSRVDKKLTAEIGHGKASFFVGYRFGKK